MSTNFFKTRILAGVTCLVLAGCGEPSNNETNQFLSLEKYTNVELTDVSVSATNPTSLSIDLQTGNATVSAGGVTTPCIVNNPTRQHLFQVMREVTVFNSGESTCSMIGHSFYTRFYSDTAEVNIYCPYYFSADGAQKIRDLYVVYKNFCGF